MGGGDGVDLCGQRQVFVGHPAGVVGGQGEAHPAPADVDVGMMVGFLGRLRHVDDDRDAGKETRGADGAFDALGASGPSGSFFQG